MIRGIQPESRTPREPLAKLNLRNQSEINLKGYNNNAHHHHTWITITVIRKFLGKNHQEEKCRKREQIEPWISLCIQRKQPHSLYMTPIKNMRILRDVQIEQTKESRKLKRKRLKERLSARDSLVFAACWPPVEAHPLDRAVESSHLIRAPEDPSLLPME